MEEIETPAAFSFRDFFIRSWLFQILITLAAFILILKSYIFGSVMKASHATFVATGIFLIVTIMHTMFLFIFAIRRLARKSWVPAMCFALHAVTSALVVYYLYVYIVLYLTFFTLGGKMIRS